MTMQHFTVYLTRGFLAPTVEVSHALKGSDLSVSHNEVFVFGALEDDALLQAIDATIAEVMMRFGYQNVRIEIVGLQGIGEHIARHFGLDGSAHIMMDDCGTPNIMFGDWSMTYDGPTIHLYRHP